MRRATRRIQLSISLFPFISVLLCAMGVLIVVISTQNMLALGSADFVIRIGGSEQEKEAIFVDCTEKGIVILPECVEVPLGLLRQDADTPFATLLDTLELSEGKKYLVLLVRPEGIESYSQAKKLATEVWNNIEIGKDALLPGSGDVILQSKGM